MSDYYSRNELNDMELPLFSSAAVKRQARSWHERDEAQANVLSILRSGERMEKKNYESSVKNGSRLAPVIEQLRNAHGFSISGDGSIKNPYGLLDLLQKPSLARVTPEMKAAYYASHHWNSVRAQRLAKDSYRCVLCWAVDDLRCHHVSYAHLFSEPLVDLLTLCDGCHDRVHKNCGLKFPSGVSVQYAHWLGWKGFEPWLLP